MFIIALLIHIIIRNVSIEVYHILYETIIILLQEDVTHTRVAFVLHTYGIKNLHSSIDCVLSVVLILLSELIYYKTSR